MRHFDIELQIVDSETREVLAAIRTTRLNGEQSFELASLTLAGILTDTPSQEPLPPPPPPDALIDKTPPPKAPVIKRKRRLGKWIGKSRQITPPIEPQQPFGFDADKDLS